MLAEDTALAEAGAEETGTCKMTGEDTEAETTETTKTEMIETYPLDLSYFQMVVELLKSAIQEEQKRCRLAKEEML